MFGFTAFIGAPYVPSLNSDIKHIFDDNLYAISSKDVFIDLGSGDGKILKLALKKGAKSVIGYEINPILYLISKLRLNSKKNSKMLLEDYWLCKFNKDTTVVYTFMVTRDMKRLSAKIQEESNRLKRSLYLISYGNTVDNKDFIKKYRAHYLYLYIPE
jgi:predicted RNA methylase